MDTFIDKLAQKFTAQEMIKANSAAEAKENRKLKEQIEVYEDLLQQMKQLNLKNMESAEAVRKLVAEGNESIKNAFDSISPNQNEDKQQLEEMFAKLDDSIHKENVKVYRNVQAVINEQTDTLKNQFGEDGKQQLKSAKKQHTFLNIMSIVILIAVLADIVLQVVRILGLV